MIKASIKIEADVEMPEDIEDWDKIQARMSEIADRRAQQFASAMDVGLAEAADRAEQDLAMNDELTPSFNSIKDDADHVQFLATGGQQSKVGTVIETEREVGVNDDPTPSGKSPEVVVQAFEYGSAAWNVPATAFSQKVIENQSAAAEEDLKEIEKLLK